ncbi:hypothetical protein EVAR_22726_1 [Eumeta japonica]|uniref:Uncharacterized protein n=1 Tax=Eumeta variegata TaxID=151549 RepID=A0A4C1UU67_EUMVA|nr:hypothetical protein EVAR_22726_1 [Eumeta japonica]
MFSNEHRSNNEVEPCAPFGGAHLVLECPGEGRSCNCSGRVSVPVCAEITSRSCRWTSDAPAAADARNPIPVGCDKLTVTSLVQGCPLRQNVKSYRNVCKSLGFHKDFSRSYEKEFYTWRSEPSHFTIWVVIINYKLTKPEKRTKDFRTILTTTVYIEISTDYLMPFGAGNHKHRMTSAGIACEITAALRIFNFDVRGRRPMDFSVPEVVYAETAWRSVHFIFVAGYYDFREGSFTLRRRHISIGDCYHAYRFLSPSQVKTINLKVVYDTTL